MDKENIDISFGKQSNLDSHPSQLDDKAYTYMLNGNLEDQNGNGQIMLQNEHSNILCSKFKDGFKVLGHEIDITSDRVYYFIKNTSTGDSEIGYIENVTNVKDISDIEINCGCNIKNTLSEPLENIEQEETCEYVTLLSDACEGLDGYHCLNFNITYPISSELKDEKCGKVLYFTDDLNDIRRIELNNLEQYKFKEEFCEEGTEGCDCGKAQVDVCLDCEKLKLFKSYSIPCIDVELISGGTLRHGVYVFYIAYSDENANEITSYKSITGEVNIKDSNKNIYQQPELDAITNLSIKLNISRLDVEADYYKVAVMQRSGLDGVQSYFEVGTYPTSKKEVLFSSTDNKQRITIQELVKEFPLYKTAKNLEAVNDSLFISDLTSQSEINLQPVVNLMGQFLKWRTYIAEEDIYDNPELIEKYRTFIRNEVYPLGIRFGSKDYVTSLFNLINRIATNQDLYFGENNDIEANPEQILQDGDNGNILNGYEKDVYSILKNTNTECSIQERKWKWQYYNTSYEINKLDCVDIEFEEVDIVQERTCENEFQSCPIGSFSITELEEGYVYEGLENFINDFPNSDQLPDCLKPSFYVEDNDSNDGANYCCETPEDLFQDNCGDVTYDSSFVEVLGLSESGTLNELVIYETCNFYERISPPSDCNIYEIDTGGNFANLNQCCEDCRRRRCKNNSFNCEDGEEPCCDWDFVYVVDNSCHPKNPVWERALTTSGTIDCQNATSLPLDSDYQIPAHLSPFYESSDIIVNDVDLIENMQQLNRPTTTIDLNIPLSRIRNRCRGNGIDNATGQFTNRLHKNALWFKVDNIPTGGVVINISEMVNCPTSKKKQDCLLYSEVFRYHIYDGCSSSSNLISSGFITDSGACDTISDTGVTKDDGNHIVFVGEEALDLNNDGERDVDELYIVIDAPLVVIGTAIEQDSDNVTSGVIDTFSNNSGTVLALESGNSYIGIFSTGGSGVGASFDITRDGTGAISSVTLNSGGESYLENDILVIDGSFIGGSSGVDDLTITVLTLTITGVEKNYGYVTGTCGCFSVSAFTPSIRLIQISGDKTVTMNSICTYTSNCTTRVYEDLKCEPVAWAEGKFSYWESTNIYPDNSELYDSSGLIITIDDIIDEIKSEFEEVFTSGVNNNEYILNDNTNFKCKPIRHFKMPDNCVSPYQDGLLSEGGLAPFNANRVFPLGVHINNEIINSFLDIAVSNGLITQEFRDSIEYYEIFRGDTRLHKSVMGKGIMYDGWEYEESDTTNVFPNFPFNDNSRNKLIQETGNRDYLQHPYDGNGNNKFYFHSPEFSFEKPNIPFELEVESYLLGESKGNFVEVEDHPSMVLMSDKAYRVARILATIETTLEIATDVTDRLLQVAQSSFVGLTVDWGQAAAWVGFGLYTAERIVYESLLGGRLKVYEWLKIFNENGNPYNFASYYVAEGYYNKIACPETNGDRLRGLLNSEYVKNGRYSYNVNTGVTGVSPLDKIEEINLNHYNRVSSVFLYLGNESRFGLEHPVNLRNYDNSRPDFDSTCSFTTNDLNGVKQSPSLQRNIYAPYVSLKRYLPSQYGEIDDISWISCNYCGDLNKDNNCEAVFGGDGFISRFTFKRHFPFFINPMITPTGALGDVNTPFSYLAQRNIGFPTYYVNYLTDQTNNFGNFELPTIRSQYNLDCINAPRMYILPPSKFYLWYYGVPNLLVESRINLNYRYGQNNRDRDFYPNQSDLLKWTQEKNVGNDVDNFYFYNNVYSTENDIYAYRTLPFNYNKEEWDCRFDLWDSLIYSLPDVNEQDVIDNWTVFRANNFYKFGNKYGTFYGLKNIESQKVLGRFENGIVVLNAFNTIQGTVEDVQIGTGGIFATRPTEFFSSDIGYGGTQNRAFVSSEFGHFWVDAKRGRVFKINPNGTGLEEISRYRWKNWFRENLPFKIKNQFPNITEDDLDNPYNGVGITMGWDDRYSRLFITKKDYKLKDNLENCCIEYIEGVGFVNNLTKCEDNPQIITCPDGYTYNEDTEMCERNNQESIEPILIDDVETIDIKTSDCFEDCSWTVAYNPVYQQWIGWYSFKPNYYVSHNNYFQTGLNKEQGFGVWSHLLTNKSFQVFYGDIYPFKIEVLSQNKFSNKYVEHVSYWLDVRRYHNEHDFAENRNKNFNTAVVYNNDESTGLLNLVRQEPNNRYQLLQYPKFNTNSWDILATQEHRRWSFNYIVNNVVDKYNNVPIWLNNCANDDKTLNNLAFNYKPVFKDKLRGDWFKVRFSQESDSQHKYIFKWLEVKNKLYRR